MYKAPSILVVDDELQILRAMRASLSANGYEVRTAKNGEECLTELRKEMPDLVILDLVMPDISGLEVCRRVREFSKTPIIVLSAKGSDQDKITALDLGADDYVTKPFNLDILLARIRAVLRRTTPNEQVDSILKVDAVVVDTESRRVLVAGKEVKLTPKEFEVLRYLIIRAGKIVTHRALLQSVWGWEYADQTEYLRVFVNQLRRKIEPDPHHPCYIMTEPWVGYRFAQESSDPTGKQ
ncbi:MAG: two-component system OmpR family KDP operon response regulator KdpE [bacterium]|nr:MAG: two-component system OmpR family KDP operon response regulator KdpE [bacterium]